MSKLLKKCLLKAVTIITVLSILASLICTGVISGMAATPATDANGDYKWLNITAKGLGSSNGGGQISAILTNEQLGLEEGKAYVFYAQVKGDKLGSGNLWVETYNSTSVQNTSTRTDKVMLDLTGGAWNNWTRIDSVSGGGTFTDTHLVMGKYVKLAVWVKNTTTTDAVINFDGLTCAEYNAATNTVVAGSEKQIDLEALVSATSDKGSVEFVDNSPVQSGKDTSTDASGDYKWLNITAKGMGSSDNGGQISATLTNAELGLEEGKAYVFYAQVKGDKLGGGNLWIETYNSASVYNTSTRSDKIMLDLTGGPWDNWTRIDSVAGGGAFTDTYLVMDKYVRLAVWVKNTTTNDVVVNLDGLTCAEYDTTTNTVVAGSEKQIDLEALVSATSNKGSVEFIDNSPPEPGKDTSDDANGDKKWLNITAKGMGSSDNGGQISATLTNAELGLEEGKAYVFYAQVKGDKLGSGNLWIETYNSASVYNTSTRSDKIMLDLTGGAWRNWTRVDSVAGGGAFTDAYLVMDKYVRLAVWVKNTTENDVVVNLDGLTCAEYDTTTNTVVAGTEKQIDLEALVSATSNKGSVELINNSPIEPGKDTSADANGDKKWLNVTVYGKGTDSNNRGGAVSATLTNDKLGLEKGKSYVISLYVKGDKLTNGNLWFETYNAEGTATDKVEVDLTGGAWRNWTKADAEGKVKFPDNIFTVDEIVKASVWAKNTTNDDVVINLDAIVISEYNTTTGTVIAGTEKETALSGFVGEDNTYGKTELVDKNPPSSDEDDDDDDDQQGTPTESGKDTSADWNGDKLWLNVTAYGKGSSSENKGGAISSTLTNDKLGLEKGKSYVVSLYAKGDKLTNGNLWFEAYNAEGTATDKVELNLAGGAWNTWTKVDSKGSSKFTDNVLTMDETVKASVWVKNTTDADAVVNLDAIVISEYDTVTNTVIAGTEKEISLSWLVKAGQTYGKTELVDKNPPPEPGKETKKDNDSDDEWLNVTVYGKGNNSENKGGAVSAVITDAVLEVKKGKAYVFSLYAKGDKLTNGNMWFETYDADKNVTDKVQILLTDGAWRDWTKVESVAAGEKYNDNYLVMGDSLKIGIWVKNLTDNDVVINIDTVSYAEYDVLGGKVLENTRKSIRLTNFIDLYGEAGKTEFVDQDGISYQRIDPVNFSKFNSVKNAVIKAGGYKDGTAIYLKVPKAGENASISASLKGVYNGVYTVTAYVKSSGGFSTGHVYANNGMELKASVKDKISEWTRVEIPYVEVKDNTLSIGVWLKGEKGGEYVWIDDVELKLHGKPDGEVNPYFTKTIDIKNTDFSTHANTMLAAGGYINSTKLVLSGTEDYKGSNAYRIKGLKEGSYTLTAWVKSSGGHRLVHMFANAGSDSTTQITAPFTKWQIDEWTQIEITGIEVSKKGELQIGFWTNSVAGKWVEIDGVQLKKEGYRIGSNFSATDDEDDTDDLTSSENSGSDSTVDTKPPVSDDEASAKNNSVIIYIVIAVACVLLAIGAFVAVKFVRSRKGR